jgi:hypothetical protein
MLTEQESLLVKRLFAQGPSALFEEGYEDSQVEAFMAREEVRRELRLLEQELKHKDVLEQRSRFITRRNLQRLTGGAVAILGRALQGPVYLRDEEGAIRRDAKGHPLLAEDAIHPSQMVAARTIIDTLGVGEAKPVTLQDINVTALIQQQLNAETKAMAVLDHDASLVKEEQRVLSRERMRNVIERMMPKIAHAKQTIEASVHAEVKNVTTRQGQQAKPNRRGARGKRAGHSAKPQA